MVLVSLYIGNETIMGLRHRMSTLRLCQEKGRVNSRIEAGSNVGPNGRVMKGCHLHVMLNEMMSW